ERLKDVMKTAMRAIDKVRLGVIRLTLAAIQQREIDERITLDNDEQVTAVIDKMIKQRRDSISQYQNAARNDLAEIEQQEITILMDYMPSQLSAAEIEAELAAIIVSTGASGPQDIGKVMGAAKGKFQGRADMGQVSQLVKSTLAAL
ncbi:MAG: GatB/YqeY domain-containing protein, partial [Pseudomonadota bacterium]|nr:GatB/YqeY domain-containing protein [Pseudomonadota bacterium]